MITESKTFFCLVSVQIMTVGLLMLSSPRCAAESIEVRVSLSEFPETKSPVPPTSTRSTFEIPRCEAKGGPQPYSYSTALNEKVQTLRGSTPLNSAFELSGMDPDATINKFQHTNNVHYDILQISESSTGSDSIIVYVKLTGYWKVGAVRNHKIEDDHPFGPCRETDLGWKFCRDDLLEQIVRFLLTYDKLHR